MCAFVAPAQLTYVLSTSLCFYLSRGNYDTFKEQEAIKMEKHQKAWVAQEKRIR